MGRAGCTRGGERKKKKKYLRNLVGIFGYEVSLQRPRLFGRIILKLL
jgi:hypothetical protein